MSLSPAMSGCVATSMPRLSQTAHAADVRAVSSVTGLHGICSTADTSGQHSLVPATPLWLLPDTLERSDQMSVMAITCRGPGWSCHGDPRWSIACRCAGSVSGGSDWQPPNCWPTFVWQRGPAP